MFYAAIVLAILLMTAPAKSAVRYNIKNKAINKIVSTADFVDEAEGSIWKAKHIFRNTWGHVSEYTITEIDITQELMDKEASENAEIAERKALKNLVNTINNSSLPAWHKRLHLMQIKDMRE